MKNLVDSRWLKENLENDNLVVVDCRFDLMDKEYGKRCYEKEHIKGAMRIDIETELSSTVKEHGGRHPLPDIEQLKNVFENIGISDDSVVVAYDDGDLAGPSRLWWILKYLGHEEVYVLDGGISVFKEIGGEVDSCEVLPKKGNIKLNINKDMIVDMNYVKERLHKDNIAIVDSRENIRYIGEWEPVDKRAGHIPSAMNYFWKDILETEPNRLKSVEGLLNHFKELKNYDEVIIYCGSGITASCNSLALSEIGIENKVYAGSFSDWISYEDNKVDTK